MLDAAAPDSPVIEVSGLNVTFRKRDGDLQAVTGVDFALRRGEVLTILGESGSGKSVSLKALMRLLPHYAHITGRVSVAGTDVPRLPPRDLADFRGRGLSMVFQEPMTALDPVYTIGRQIAETIVQHEGVGYGVATNRARELLERVRIPSAARRLKNHPHELSGGMRQRAMIALALACNPAVLLADEPTTALDVTVQIQILLLLRELQRELGLSIVFVTHDLGAAVEIADRIAVMYAGRIVETGTAREVLRDARHPYTKGLMASTVHGGLRGQQLVTIPGNPPSLGAIPAGCAFRPRCRHAHAACEQEPPVVVRAPGATARCVLPVEAGEPVLA